MNTGNKHAPVAYDRYGRMQYHPEFHARQKLPWTTSEERYLIDNYATLGPEAISFALERTIHTVMTRAYELRKKSVMQKSLKKQPHRRSSFGLNRPTNAMLLSEPSLFPIFVTKDTGHTVILGTTGKGMSITEFHSKTGSPSSDWSRESSPQAGYQE